MNHPNIVRRIHDTGTHHGASRTRSRKELLQGETLTADRLRAGADRREAGDRAHQPHSRRARGGLHAQGVIHRDIKPENIFLYTNATAARRDPRTCFGIARIEKPTQVLRCEGPERWPKAKARAESSVSRQEVGRLPGTSPEQIRERARRRPASDRLLTSGPCTRQRLTGAAPPRSCATPRSTPGRGASRRPVEVSGVGEDRGRTSPVSLPLPREKDPADRVVSRSA